MKRKFLFTDDKIAALTLPERGRATYYDNKLPGLAVRVYPSGKRQFTIIKKTEGKLRYIAIGTAPPLTVDDTPDPDDPTKKLPGARNRARKALLLMADGKDPVAVNKAERAAVTPLKEAFERYIRDRDLKPRSIEGYRANFDRYLADWYDKPITVISRDAVVNRFEKITKDAGPAAANATMSALRAVLNYSRGVYETADGRPLVDHNPVSKLSELRRWNRLERRRRTIPFHQLKSWYTAVNALPNPTHRDYILFLLFTGLRRTEAANLRWQDVDEIDGSFVIPDTKNRNPLRLPLTDVTAELLKRADRACEWVFPNEAHTGPVTKVDKSINKVTAQTGIEFSAHDLRRTLATVAETVAVPMYTIKSLLNHVTPYSDVTGGYLGTGIERLREPAQRIAEFLKKATGITPDADGTNVVQLRRA